MQVSETRFSNTAAILAHLCSEIHFVTPYLGRHALTKTQVGFGDINGPKPYKFIGFGDIHGPKPYKFYRVW